MKKNEGKTEAVRPLLIKNIDELQKIVSEPLIVAFKIDEQLIHLPVRRATPMMMESYREIVRAVQPPFKNERKDYDPLDEKYINARDLAMKTARAFLVYSCCSAISAGKPGLTDTGEIYRYVRGLLTDNILELIELKAQAGGLNIDVEVQKGANFTLPPGSES